MVLGETCERGAVGARGARRAPAAAAACPGGCAGGGAGAWAAHRLPPGSALRDIAGCCAHQATQTLVFPKTVDRPHEDTYSFSNTVLYQDLNPFEALDLITLQSVFFAGLLVLGGEPILARTAPTHILESFH